MSSQQNKQKDSNVKQMVFALNPKQETPLSAPLKITKAYSLDSNSQSNDGKQKILNPKSNANIEIFQGSDSHQKKASQQPSNPIITNQTQIKYLTTKSIAGYKPYQKELKVNQDSLNCIVSLQNQHDRNLFLLADGHGEYGAEVSQLAVQLLTSQLEEKFFKNFNEQKPSDEEIHTVITTAFDDVEIQLEQSLKVKLQESGSSMNMVITLGDTIISANIGDSRGLYFQKNIKTDDSEPATLRIKQLSSQHTPERPNELDRILSKGGKIEQDTQGFQKTGPLKIKSKKLDIKGSPLTRAFGDTLARQVGVISEPEIQLYQIKAEGYLILMTDSILEMIDIIDICRILTPITPPNSQTAVDLAADEIIEEARRKSKLQPDSEDDYSLILVYVQMD